MCAWKADLMTPRAIDLITNARVLLPTGELAPVEVRLAEGRIAEIGAGLTGAAPLDARGGYLLPGLVDLHAHGLGMFSLERGALADWATLEAAHGVTRFFPTLFGPPEVLVEQLTRHRRETDELRAAPNVGGFRLESPYLANTGAGLRRDLAPISPALTARLLDAGGGHIRLWDISPELPDARAAIGDLASRGIVCSLAHTRATITQARAAVDAGARLVTHLFDTFVVPEMTDPGVYPAGLTDYLLVEDRVTCEIIADGTHVHPLLVEKTLRCKGVGRTVFITDSNYGAGLPPGDYDLPAGWGAARIAGPNHGVRLIHRDLALAGSALTPLDAFHNAIRLFGQSLAAASQLCAVTPARLLGLNTGEIAVGRQADLLVVSPELAVQATIVGGQLLFAAEMEDRPRCHHSER